MDINLVVSKIPQIIASLYEDIFVIDKTNQKFYRIKYDGKKLAISVPEEYSNLNMVFADYQDDFLKRIENINNFQTIISDKEGRQKLISMKTVEEVKLIFISHIGVSNEENANKQILLVADDSPIVTNFFKKALEGEFKIIIAKNGEETIDLIEKYQNEGLVAVFLDLNMPKKNGYEVLEYFKTNNLFEKIPVSIISGEDNAESIEKVASFEIVDILQKPFTAEAIKKIVDKTIQSINRD